MKKRIISAALATLMAASALSTSAFAAGLKSDATLDAAGTVNVPAISVTVPTSAAFVINPYKLNVKVENTSASGGKTDTIVPLYDSGKEGWEIKNNNTDVKMDVSMYATYKAGKTVQVNATEETKDATKKQLTLALKLDSTAVTLLEKAPAAWVDDASTTDVTENEGVAKITLDKASSESSPAVKLIKLDASSKADVTAGLAWTESDTCTISMAFKFDIVANS